MAMETTEAVACGECPPTVGCNKATTEAVACVEYLPTIGFHRMIEDLVRACGAVVPATGWMDEEPPKPVDLGHKGSC